jgi:hypothetical protein
MKPLMGMAGTWFVATEDEAERMLSIRGVAGIHPFTRERAEIPSVAVDEAVLAGLPRHRGRWLLPTFFEAIFGGIPARLLTPYMEPTLHRILPDAAAALACDERSSADLATAAKRELEARGERRPWIDLVDEPTVAALRQLATDAHARRAGLYVLVG